MQKSVKSKKVERGEGGEAGVAGDAQGWRCSAVQQSTQNALSTCTKMAPLLSGKNLEREQNERIFEGTLGVVKKVLGRPWRSHGSSLSKESGG